MAETAFFAPKLYKGTAGREAERPLRGNQRGEVRRKQGGGGATRRTPTMLLAWAQAKTPFICGISLKRNGGMRHFHIYVYSCPFFAANGLPPFSTA
jgi:hypothetical protein